MYHGFERRQLCIACNANIQTGFLCDAMHLRKQHACGGCLIGELRCIHTDGFVQFSRSHPRLLVDPAVERKKVEGRIRSLTAQGVSQGVIIVCMPFVLAGILYMMDPELIRRLWTTWPGLIMILMMLILQTLGGAMIRKIVRIEV